MSAGISAGRGAISNWSGAGAAGSFGIAQPLDSFQESGSFLTGAQGGYNYRLPNHLVVGGEIDATFPSFPDPNGLTTGGVSNLVSPAIGAASYNENVLAATHDLDIVEDIADRCVILQSGRVAASDAPEAVLNDVDLLMRTRLAHAHRHAFGDGTTHSHHHLHRIRRQGNRQDETFESI